jgi:hypothetical protein
MTEDSADASKIWRETADASGRAAPMSNDHAGAVERLTALATDCDYAAMPTKPDVVTLCGWSAGQTRDDLRTILSALSASEARLRVAVEALGFYADEHEFPSDGPWGVNSDDFGQRARAALATIEGDVS